MSPSVVSASVVAALAEPPAQSHGRLFVTRLSGNRLHLNDGPIDLVIGADGEAEAIAAAYRSAMRRFDGLLDELCAELPSLRRAAAPGDNLPGGRVARRMTAAVKPYAADHFITPMAAVAGAVADEILAVMVDAADLTRAYVNNGGDIAIHLKAGEHFDVGLVDRPDRPSLCATSRIAAGDPVRGIATSGWRGRSFSLGIADAVTVLAATAAEADAAATIIANSVDLPGHPAVTRVAAHSLQPDNDLGDRLVTRAVGPLTPDEVTVALQSGGEAARRLRDLGLIVAAALHLAGNTRTIGIADPALTNTQ